MTNQKRRCSICGKMLCSSNKNDYCWSHDVPRGRGENIVPERITGRDVLDVYFPVFARKVIR